MKTKNSFKNNGEGKKKLKKSTLRQIAILASALIVCASGWASFKIGEFPFYFTLQNMFCIFFGALWGSASGAAITGLMLALGTLGVPVFAHGNCGAEYIAGQTGGFLLGYFFAAMLTGYIIKKPSVSEKTPLNKIISACLGGFLLIYVIGIAHYFGYHKIKFTKESIKLLSIIGLKWYIASDFIKMIICSVGAYFLRPVFAKIFYDEPQ